MKIATTLTLCVFLPCAAPALAQSTFHGDVARTGVYASPGPRQFGGVKWAFKAAGPIVTSPAIADGVVYIGSMSGHLYAIDQETGKEKWNFKSRMPIASSPALGGGVVLVVSWGG
jgi:outer membrane protein assembly factor BamB